MKTQLIDQHFKSQRNFPASDALAMEIFSAWFGDPKWWFRIREFPPQKKTKKFRFRTMNQAQNMVFQWKKMIDEFWGRQNVYTKKMLRKNGVAKNLLKKKICWEKCLRWQNIYTKNIREGKF